MVAENSPTRAADSRTPVARVPLLDVLRLVAVCGVILFHYGFRGPTTDSQTFVALPALDMVARYGYLGVPVFFIISGFVIAYSAHGRTATEFAIARFARIYPTFVLCMTITCVATLLLGAPLFEATPAQWLANLVIASPVLEQPYMDSAYWSLVAEVTFYAWVAALMARRLFPRHIDSIVIAWLGLSMLNELTIDAGIVEKVFLADYSGFFATGLLIYEVHRGRRDVLVQILLACSIAVAVFQAVHNLSWLRHQTGFVFDDWVVAAICLASIWAIIRATNVRSLPIPAGVTLAIGGLTYPLYLLHQKLGYVILGRLGELDPHGRPTAVVIIMLAIFVASWLVWRVFERRAQPWTRIVLQNAVVRAPWRLARKRVSDPAV